jgi:hypothetical protein
MEEVEAGAACQVVRVEKAWVMVVEGVADLIAPGVKALRVVVAAADCFLTEVSEELHRMEVVVVVVQTQTRGNREIQSLPQEGQEGLIL